MKKLDEALFSAQQDNIRLKKNCFEANEQIFEANVKFDGLQRDAQAKEDLYQRQLRDHQTALAEKTKALDQALSEATRLTEEKAAWSPLEVKYTTALRELDQQLASMEQDMRTDQREFLQRIQALEEEGRTKQNPDLDRAMKEIDRLEAQIHELQIHMNKGADKRHIEPLQAIINSLTVQVSEVTEENQQLKATIAALRQTIVDAEVRLGMLERGAAKPSQGQQQQRPSSAKPDLSKLTPTQLQDMIGSLKDENLALSDYLDRILSQIMMRPDLLFLLKRE